MSDHLKVFRNLCEALNVEYDPEHYVDYVEQDSSCTFVPWNKGKKGLQEPWNKGLKTGPPSQETIDKLSRIMIEKYNNEPPPAKGKPSGFKGKKHSEESKAKSSLSHKDQVPWNKGKKHSPETIEKIRAARRKNTK